MKGKIGIALGGGAARGWAHIGVIKALRDAGIHPDIVVGTSIGAVVGGCYVANHLDHLEEFATGLSKRSVFSYLDFSLTGTSLISGQRLCSKLEARIKIRRIEDMEKKFAAVATEMESGHEVWLKRGRLIDAMRASYAIPGVFRPVRVKNRWLMDGAIVNPVPVSVCRALGARTVIAVNLNSDSCKQGTIIPDYDFGDEPVVSCHEEPVQAEAPQQEPGNTRSALKLLHRQFFGEKNDDTPGMTSVMMDAVNITQDRIARSRLAGDPPDLMISPRLDDIGLFEFYRANEAIEAGRAATNFKLNEFQENIGELVS